MTVEEDRQYAFISLFYIFSLAQTLFQVNLLKDGTITELTHISSDMIPSFANTDNEYIGIMVDDTMLDALNC